MYANVMYWFIAICSLIFLSSMLFVEELARLFIKKEAYFENPGGLYIVPILLMANLCLGVYYNLSVWYQLTNNTRTGALVAAGGALVTIALNILFIPHYGFIACAWITLAVYAMMCIAAYIMGHHYYRIPYYVGKYLLLVAAALVLWGLEFILEDHLKALWQQIMLNTLLLASFLLIIWMLQPK